jgi:hypothetical protein
MKYTFFKDELGQIWYRDVFTVEAGSYEEAEEKAIAMVKNDKVNDVDYSEPLWETWSSMTPEDNDRFSTVELQSSESYKILWENGK